MERVVLDGDYDFADVSRLRDQLLPLSSGQTDELDCSAVTYFDSAALAELIRARRLRGKTFKIIASREIGKILHIAGLRLLFEIEDRYQESRAASTP